MNAAYPPPFRSAVESAIEALIALLDAIDGDPDAEPDMIEPDGDDQDFDDVLWHRRSGAA